jgi:hypothetical protein
MCQPKEVMLEFKQNTIHWIQQMTCFHVLTRQDTGKLSMFKRSLFSTSENSVIYAGHLVLLEW